MPIMQSDPHRGHQKQFSCLAYFSVLLRTLPPVGQSVQIHQNAFKSTRPAVR